MSVEIVHISTEHLIDFAPIPIGFIGWLWYYIRKQRHDLDGTPMEKIEVHHKKRRWQGGQDTKDNLIGLTIVEHAEDHYNAAHNAADNRARRAEYGALNLITKRMNDEERQEFNRRIKRGV